MSGWIVRATSTSSEGNPGRSGYTTLTYNAGNNTYSTATYPFTINLTSGNYAQAGVTDGLGAAIAHEATGSWSGGPCLKLTPPNVNEGYCGVGMAGALIGTDNGSPLTISVNFMVYAGSTLGTVGPPNAKPLIIQLANGVSGDRPMILIEHTDAYSTSAHSVRYRSCSSTVCTAPAYGASTFMYGDGAHADIRNEEWINVELLVDLTSGTAKLYEWSRDGVITGLQATHSGFPTNTTISIIDKVGGYWGNASDGWPRTYDANTYLKISDIYVSSVYQGPPTGFVTG